MATATELTDSTWDAAVVRCKALVLIDFYTTWCPHCKSLRPVIDQLAGEYAGRASICAVDVDANTAVGKAQIIHAIPVVRIYHGGNLAIWEHVGEDRIQVYRDALDRLLKTSQW